MKAVALRRYLPINDPEALLDLELADPVASGYDVLVRVEAVSVNPVDTKVRSPKDLIADPPRVLGYDAAGVVVAIGDQVEGFAVGDAVFYAGAINRNGSNSELQAVDSRIVAHKPQSLDFADAAALPLTAITAWELLFERIGIDPDGSDAGRSVLIIAGAGGVGSIAIQLAKQAGLTVIATASRPDTIAWCKEFGADHVIDHRQPLAEGLKGIGFDQVDIALNLFDTDAYWKAIGEILAPEGHVGLIVEPSGDLRIGDPYKAKSIGIHWEMMFTRAVFGTKTIARQGALLARVATLIDAGNLRSTRSETLGAINAANLREAHRRLEAGTTIGKLVLAGW